MLTISSIVEGHGEIESVPILIRRIRDRIAPAVEILTPRPTRLPRTKLTSPHELARAIALAKGEIQELGAILIIMDADADCPATLGPAILAQASAVAGTTPVGVVIAKSEYEAWFLASAASLSGRRGLRNNLTGPPDPESIASAKSWLGDNMPPNRRYRETLDQAALTSLFDIDQALKSPSFNKCYREIAKLLGYPSHRSNVTPTVSPNTE